MCIELFDQSGNSLMLSQDEWHAIRYMAQDRGWRPLGSHHPDIKNWRGSYKLGGEAAWVGHKDLRNFREALHGLDVDESIMNFLNDADRIWIC